MVRDLAETVRRIERDARRYGGFVARRSSTVGDDLSAALTTFAIFAWELLVLLLIDPLLADAEQASVWHHLITAAGWTTGAYFLARHAQQIGLIVNRRRVSAPLPVGAVRGVFIGGAVVLAIAVRAVAFGELKVVGETTTLISRGGIDAIADVLALGVYYVSEAFLIMLLILFAQRAGERRFGRHGFPWGGLVLALTWGVMHLFLQGPSAGLYAMFAAILYGIIVTLGPRSIWATWLCVAVAFII